MQADPEERQQPQTVVVPGFAGSGGARGVVRPQRAVLELRAQISVVLLQQLPVHRQQAVRTDVVEGDLSNGRSGLIIRHLNQRCNFKYFYKHSA